MTLIKTIWVFTAVAIADALLLLLRGIISTPLWLRERWRFSVTYNKELSNETRFDNRRVR